MSDLAARLHAHVPRRFASAGLPWWGPLDENGLPGRAAAVEELALLVAGGRDVRVSIAAMQAEHRDRGGRSDRLGVPAERLDAGATVHDAVRAWARASGCGELGVLAVELQRAVDTDQVIAALDRSAMRLRHRADAVRAARAARRGRVVVAGAIATSAASVLLVLA